MKARYIFLILCASFLVAGCSDNDSSKKQPDEKIIAGSTVINPLSVAPKQFAEYFNKCMEGLGKNFRIEEEPKIKVGPNQNTFQSTPTHQITIIGTVDKKTGLVVNVMLVARGNDEQGMGNIIVHATCMVAGYKPEIASAEATKEISRLVAAYNPQKEEPISKIYKNLRLTYGMQTDMGLSHFSIRPVE